MELSEEIMQLIHCQILENQKVIMNALGLLTAIAPVQPLLKDAHKKTTHITNVFKPIVKSYGD